MKGPLIINGAQISLEPVAAQVRFVFFFSQDFGPPKISRAQVARAGIRAWTHAVNMYNAYLCPHSDGLKKK